MSIKINELVDIEIGKAGHICAHGPSLSRYVDYLSSLHREDNIIFSCNEFFAMSNLYPDYWVIANPGMKIDSIPWGSHERICDIANKFERTTLLYADSVDNTDRQLVSQLLKGKYYGYDQRHFESKPLLEGNPIYSDMCIPESIGYRKDCCKHIVKGRLTLQEELQKKSGYDKHYHTGDTVSLHMIAFAVLMGCNPIYVYGLDLDYSLGYVNKSVPIIDSFDFWLPRIESDLFIINESAKLLNISIINRSDSNLCKKIFKE